jgi:succinate dehydrogenase/fumarate reductase flavoprotein subunit
MAKSTWIPNVFRVESFSVEENMVARETLRLEGGVEVPIWRVNTLVVGSGAAALNAAVHLCQFWIQKGVPDAEGQVLIITDGLGHGASRLSGSDKQTYYKLGTSSTAADSPRLFAETLTANGCMHGDHALIEAENSLREFYHLVDLGVPFPHTPEGGFIGYKTDHDPLERGTSAGPKTSRYMFECLYRVVQERGIRILEGYEFLDLLTAGEGDGKRVIGAVAISRGECGSDYLGLNLFQAENVVVATGGPGAMYATSVYPELLRGNHAAGFRAGAIANNLTESQFGIASIKFRWNLSGTYQQVIPRYFSTDAEGRNPEEFLNAYFSSMRALATNIFLKGYQWPFDPQRIAGGQSSLIDVLVYHERAVRGRRVFLDFTKNPVPTGTLTDLDLSDLEPEARTYLGNSGALQETPIARLERMNPLAIELYRDHGIDIAREPLEIAVCNQHNNGGFRVNEWWESNVSHLFFVGEVAGTHGVKRPGGSALNATQVGSLRAAEFIANRYSEYTLDDESVAKVVGNQAEKHWQHAQRLLEQSGGATLTIDAALREIRTRVSTAGGHMRSLEQVREAIRDARALQAKVKTEGLRFQNRQRLVDALFAENVALTHVAYLEAIRALLERGSGSRGSHVVLSDRGETMHPELPGVWKVLPENQDLRDEIVEIWMTADGEFETRVVPVRPIPQREYWFETMWADYRRGAIYGRKEKP